MDKAGTGMLKLSNYKEFEQFLATVTGRPKLLLHVCCGPCSTAVVARLTDYFDLTLFYFNPNIYPVAEYMKRANELVKVGDLPRILMPYDHTVFTELARGLEAEREGGLRCEYCFRARMKEAAQYAKRHGFDYYSTTLSVSPHKNSKVLNRLGYEIAEEVGIPYVYSDFKKNCGYQLSVKLSNELGIYRQNYCGCEYSLKKRDERKNKTPKN